MKQEILKDFAREATMEEVGKLLRELAAQMPKKDWSEMYRTEPAIVPAFHDSSFAMHNAINCSSVFNTMSKGPRTEVKFQTQSTNGFVISYRGTQLRQDDKSVLLGLVKLKRGQYSGGKVTFPVYGFLRSIGWSANAYNKEHLTECLDRMKTSTLKMTRGAKEGLVTSFVLEYGYDGDEFFVNMSDTLANLFAFMPNLITYMNADTRRKLTDGMQTWLFDYIASNDCQRVLTYSLLATASGRAEQDAKEFAKMVKAALQKLKDVGAITDWNFAVDSSTRASGVFVTK